MRSLAGWVALALAGAAWGGEARRLTVEEALREAVAQSPRVQAARDRAEAATASADSLRGRMLPGVRLSDEQQRYDRPFAIDFAIPGAPGAAPPISLVARNVNTNTFVAAAGQPVLGL